MHTNTIKPFINMMLDGNHLEPRCTLFTKDIGLKQVAANLD